MPTISEDPDEMITVSFRFRRGDSMMECEKNLQTALNEAGSMATGKCLEHFDRDGSPLVMGGEKWTSKGLFSREYQTPYGETKIQRHLYQTARGGRTFCPLEATARVVRSATPLFARQVGHKFGIMFGNI